jgi:uncharacterized membrane protein
MDDIDDIVEGLFDIEEIAEEVADPEDLIEDFVEDPLTILVALVAAGAALFTLLMVLVTIVFLAFEFGLLLVVVGLTMLGLLATVLAVAAFLSLRRGIPHEVRREISEARRRADDHPSDGSMTEQEAIDELKEQYAEGQLSDRELETALEAAITSDRPEEVVARYERDDGDRYDNDSRDRYEREKR